MSYQKRIIRWAAIFIVLILAYLLVVARYINPILAENTNSLAIGQRSIVESLTVPIADSIDLDNMTRDEIYALRQEAIMEYPWLIYTNYEPFKAVFSNISDDLPWWGTAGWYYYGSGDMSADGPSKEALQILNPYLLVSADFSGLSIHSKATAGSFWNESLVTSAALEKDNFPFYVSPENLRWWPERSRVEVTYDLSEYLSALNHWTARSFRVGDASFDLIAYNARDLNMNYIWVDYTQSLNVTKDILPTEASGISHNLRHSDDCGLAGGCNSVDAVTPEIQGLQVKNLPAKLIIYLWNDRPSSTTDTPDITYVINIK
ncbi:MAG: hypothetical protein LLG42_12340 [Chloroflexi bacterium]|nr:hypothetical protein [Chloroflexota bacterium]